MILFLSFLFLLGAETINFDPLQIEGTIPIPQIKYERNVLSICPDLPTDSAEWIECAANLSYQDIDRLCSRMNDTFITEIMSLFSNPSVDVYRNLKIEEFEWNGCLMNSMNGVHKESYRVIWDGEHWILKDQPGFYGYSSEVSNQSAFDGYEKKEVSSEGRVFLNSTFSYILVPIESEGTWIAQTALSNQIAINDSLKENHFSQEWCDLWESPSCKVLPPLYIKAISPTLILVKSIERPDIPYTIFGIFYNSVTGYKFK